MKTILLIGPSQNGKSTFANFLCCENINSQDAPFKMGDGLKSTTKDPFAVDVEHTFEDMIEIPNLSNASGKPELRKEIKADKIRIIDTPGVGDSSPETETRNMLGLYKLLAEMQASGDDLSCAVLVSRFPNLMNDEYKKNLLFYTNMFPQVFQRNIVLVITCVSNEEKWLRQRKKAGVDVASTLEKMRTEIKTTLGLNYQITTFHVELLADEEDRDFKVAVGARKSIFDRCFKIPGLKLDALQFPKPIPWANQDSIQVKELTGEKAGITKGLEIASSKNAKLSADLAVVNSKIATLGKSATEKTRQLQEIDNGSHVTIYEGQYNDGWHMFWSSGSTFDESTEYDIVAKHWTGGYASYQVDEPKHVKGTVYKGWLRELNATLTLSTTSKNRFKEQITDLRRDLEALDQEIQKQNSEKRILEGVESENKAERDRLLSQLKTIEENITFLSAGFVSIGQMIERLPKV